MVLRISSSLACDASRVWEAVKRYDTFLFVARGFLGFHASGVVPDFGAPGVSVEGRLWLFHVIPSWRHTVMIEFIDEARRVLQTREKGGPLKVWNHRIEVVEQGEGCRYTDVLELEAGWMTLCIAAFVRVFFAWRHLRWRLLVRRLAAVPPAEV